MMAYIRVVLLVFLFLSYQINTFGQRTYFSKDLDAFKKMTEYIITHNYHNNFQNYEVLYSGNITDTLLRNFVKKYNVIIYINHAKDSTIKYSRPFIPIFMSKHKDLIFDFSSTCPIENSKRNKVKIVILDKCIYYLEF